MPPPVTASGRQPELEHALTLHRQGRLDEAEAVYRRILEQSPGDVTAQHHLGLIEAQSGRPAAGLARLAAACRHPAATADHYLNLANLRARHHDGAGALDALRTGLDRHPGHPWLGTRLAELLLDTGNPAAAAEVARDLAEAPGLTGELAMNLAAALFSAGDDTALPRLLERALAGRPGWPPANNLRAALLRRQGDVAGALAVIEHTLAGTPGDPESLRNRATLLRDLHRLPEALAAAEQALRADRNAPTAWNTCGTILLDLRAAADASFCFRQALALAPGDARAHFNLGLSCLAQGDWRTGFAEYEWRMRLDGVAPLYPDYGLRRWNGAALPHDPLHLVAEQGLGDTLQFIRLARALRGRVGRIVARVQAPLVPLLAAQPWLDEVVPLDAPPPTRGQVAALLSLPARLGLTPDSLPALGGETPYLTPDPARSAHWAARLAHHPRPWIGLAWAGDPRPHDPESARIDARRSLPLSRLAPLLSRPASFVSLQKGPAAAQAEGHPELLDWSGEWQDFADSAALVQQLDLVLSVDTATVHLAGALGTPTWMLSRFDGCWRWMLGRDDSPWYPALRLFRQPAPGDWDTPLRELATALDTWLTGFSKDTA